MLQKLLIANRGEIASRIVKTARRLGLQTVAVYSEADRNALHVAAADERVAIGPAEAAQSYLDGARIIAAAHETGADCIHPGYGFLSENPDFAAAVAAAGLVFVGPSAEAMRRLGDKASAKALAAAAGVRVVPGYDGASQDTGTLAGEAARIGFPLLIKAVAGGGGRGLRVVTAAEAFPEALASARREAEAAFGDSRVLLERQVQRPRHVEVQILADRYGNVVHLFERECSLQRRHQKVIEEAPAPGIDPALRASLTEAAIKLAHACRYEGAGTVEFLIEGGSLRADAPWFFIEANTRLQVEHPVTEAITGLDLVEWQIRIAAGQPLPLTQDAIRFSGHAMEARLNAEDPAADFRPCPGRILQLALPARGNVRSDMGVAAGGEVPPHYDSMIGKFIAHGATRAAAIDRLSQHLEQTVLFGPQTNLSFLMALLSHADVLAGELDTGLIGRDLARLVAAPDRSYAIAEAFAFLLESRDAQANAAAAHPHRPPASPWDATDAFDLVGPRLVRHALSVDDAPVSAALRHHEGRLLVEVAGAVVMPLDDAGSLPVLVDGDRVLVLDRGRQIAVSWQSATTDTGADAHGSDGVIRAPISGRIAKLAAVPGASVAKGDTIAVVEAMKMEYVLTAREAGTIARLAVAAGAQIAAGAVIAEIAKAEA